jgi:UDP-N-acetylglucosamine enolpyruvyl transferase
VQLSGTKNSITKLMIVSMLTKDPCLFSNAPRVGDSKITQEICEALGARFTEMGRNVLQDRDPHDHQQRHTTGDRLAAATAWQL